MMLHHFTTRYFPHHIPHKVKELYLSHALLGFAISLISIFEPIYFYTIGFSVRTILLYLAVVYAGYALILPLGGRLAARFGCERVMLVANFFAIAYFALLPAVKSEPRFLWFLVPLVIFYKMLRWPAFHAEFAVSGAHGERGREMTGFLLIARIVGILAPAIGGVLLASVGPNFVFGIVAVLILFSTAPLFATKQLYIRESIGYRSIFKTLFDKRLRRNVVAFLGHGEEEIWYVAWSIFMFIAFAGYRGVGFVSSVALMAGTFTTIWVGRATDVALKRDGNSAASGIVRFGATLVGLAWLFRVFLPRGITIVLVELLDRIAYPAIGLPLRAVTYEVAQKENPLMTVVTLEVALALGKLCALIVGVAVATIYPGSWTALFMVGTLFSLFYFFGGTRPQGVASGSTPLEV